MLASQSHIHFGLLLETLLGVSLVIASACVINNYIDRDIDAKMRRTKSRALASGRISPASALTYAAGLGVAGFLVLSIFTNWWVVIFGAFALLDYVAFYSLGKRRSVHGTLVGALAGAAPPVAGYLAVTDQVDAAAWLLFLAMVFWQMPHFYAISLFRQGDYKNAGLPVSSLERGGRKTRQQSLGYIIAFTLSAAVLTILGYTGFIYLFAILGLGFYWFWLGAVKLAKLDDKTWGRKMFFMSLVVTLVFSLAISVGGRLP